MRLQPAFLAFLALGVLIPTGCQTRSTPPVQLYAAIESGDLKAVKAELKRRPNLEPPCPPYNNCKPLARAAMRGRLDMVQALIEAGANPNGQNAYRGTAFVTASYWLKDNPSQADLDRVAAIRLYLIEKGIDTNQSNHFGITPFAGMAAQGDIDQMEAALRHGAKVNHQSPENGASPLMIAALHGKTQSISWLLAKGADPTLRDSRGKSARDIARDAGHAGAEAQLARAEQTAQP